jgi:hypothetical protein
MRGITSAYIARDTSTIATPSVVPRARAARDGREVERRGRHERNGQSKAAKLIDEVLHHAERGGVSPTALAE